MSNRSVRIALAAAAIFSLAACRDATNPAAPNSIAKLIAPVPGPVLNPYAWVAITAGDSHTCAMQRIGRVFCWGYDQNGELGVGPAPTLCSGYMCADVPTQILNLTFLAIAAGTNHTCGVVPDHTAWCWGANDKHQLGTTDVHPSNVPIQTVGGAMLNTISAGADLTCGAYGGSLTCWGQMPDQSSWQQPHGVFMPGVPQAFVSVGVGHGEGASPAHVCATWTDNVTPRLYCWGPNASGQAGVDPRVESFVPSATQVSGQPADAPALGDGFTCFNANAGGVGCFGTNSQGQLGTTQFLGSQTFLYVGVATSSQLHGVVAGRHHACGLDPSGNAWCWGKNNSLELGFGTMGTVSAVPMMVGGGHRFTNLAAGTNHTCGISTDGHIFCWGDDSLGQLGDKQRFRQDFGANQSATPIQASGT